MKKSVFIAALIVSGLAFKASDAQVRVHVGFNFGTAPVYEEAQPVAVDEAQYTDDDDYYYLPDADAYYNVTDQQYFYMDGGRWVSARYLPGRFRDFDWRNARHYEVRAHRPFMHNDFYRSRYNGVAGGNPNWREGYAHANGGYAPEHGGFENREGGFHGYGRPNNWGNNQAYGEGRGFRGGYPQAQGGYGQDNRFEHNRGNYGGQPAEQNNGGYQNQGQYNQPNRGQGGYQGGQNSQPSNNQGGHNWGQGGGQQNSQPSNNQGQGGHSWGGGNVQQHLANNNGPAYNNQNGMFRHSRF